ncbi:MAG TPA: hypothetical protein VMM37_03285 [Bacteroidota bacterium]|nr:hypothetical protein [Bacteroidota bacterium]
MIPTHLAKRLAWPLLFVCATFVSTVRTQTITHVDFDFPALNYDVVYLADFVDVTTNKLARNIPSFSGSISADGVGQIMLDVTASIKFRGEDAQELVFAETEPFRIDHTRTLTSADLATGSTSGIEIKGSPYRENKALRDRIQNYAEKFPTAPVGTYYIEVDAFSVTATGEKGNPLGSIRRTITVRNASPEEVQVNLVDPQPGQIISTTLPTFTWNSPNSKVTLFVYEKLPIYQSLQEAIGGVPCLQEEIDGPQTYVFPNAQDANSKAWRQLQVNHDYVWFVEATVTTNRQTVARRSEVRLFKIRLDNRQDQAVEDMMNSLGGSAGGTFSTLQNMGWSPSGSMTLDGRTITLDDVKALVAKLMAQNTPVTVRVE